MQTRKNGTLKKISMLCKLKHCHFIGSNKLSLKWTHKDTKNDSFFIVKVSGVDNITGTPVTRKRFFSFDKRYGWKVKVRSAKETSALARMRYQVASETILNTGPP